MDGMQRTSAWFDTSGPAVVVEHLVVRDSAVVAEARRWSAGHRGALPSMSRTWSTRT